MQGIGKGSFYYSFLETKPDKRRFVALKAKLSQALENASNAKIVVGGVIKVTKPVLVALISLYFTYMEGR